MSRNVEIDMDLESASETSGPSGARHLHVPAKARFPDLGAETDLTLTAVGEIDEHEPSGSAFFTVVVPDELSGAPREIDREEAADAISFRLGEAEDDPEHPLHAALLKAKKSAFELHVAPFGEYLSAAQDFDDLLARVEIACEAGARPEGHDLRSSIPTFGADIEGAPDSVLSWDDTRELRIGENGLVIESRHDLAPAP
mgnify:CR=1 FL=1